MISRFSSLKSFKNIQSTLLPKVSNKSAHPVPKTYIASTLDELSPKRATMHHIHNAVETSFSGSQFVKQTQEKAKELLHEFVHMVVHGSKSAYKDAKYLYSVTSSKSKSNYTVQEIREVKRITVDLIKFVPFYAAVIIPAGEIALLPYLYLFPRAVPSYFLADKSIKENKDIAMDKQFAAHQHLKQHLLDAMAKAGYDVSVRDPESMRQFFINNQDKLMPLLETSNMSSEMLKHASDFLMFEYVEGTYILNLLYKTTVNMPKYGVNLAMWIARNSYRAAWNHPVFDYSFKLNSFPFEGMKKQLLKYQFEKQLKSLNAQSDAMMSGLFGNLSQESIMDVVKERGFYANNAEDAKIWLEENWNQSKGAQTNMSAFWYSVVQYESL